jgi:tetratricopeptide (TPR) repeat protein
MAKYTDDDIDEIVTALQREKGRFAFLTGAGCSLSAGIPSGKKIAKNICDRYPFEIKPLSDEARENYALCMGRLSIETRKQIINGYLNSPLVKLNWAHIALACLMDQGFINRVLTFNFDNLLSRACGLLGLYPASYDFGIAPSTQPRHLVAPSILHLHGQGSGSVLLHTEKDTEMHAKEIEPLLSDTFANFPMLVMGYSGESDKVFEKIKTLYRGDQPLYWLGHDEKPNPELAKFIDEIDGSGYCKYIGGIDADEVFIKLAQKLGCFPPQVFTDPASNLLHEMEKIADFPLEKTDFKTDILKKSRSKLNDKQTRDALRLDAVDLAVLSNKPEDVPETGDAGFEEVPPEIRAWALVERGNEHFEAAKKTTSISEYEKAAQQFEAAHKIKPAMHEALNNWGLALAELAQLKQEPDLFEASFAKFEAALKIKPNKHEALNNWGLALSDLAQLKQELVLFVASFAKFEAALKIKPDMYEAFYNRGNALKQAWSLTKDTKYFEQATEALNKAEKINPEKCYNSACLAAIKNDEEGCKERLFRAKAAKSLPPRKHLEDDDDLANMRDKVWFAELLEGL